MHTITGATGGGKTAFVVNLTRAALRSRHPVVYVSLELDATELAARLLAMETDLSWCRLALRRALSADQLTARDNGISQLGSTTNQFVALVPDADVKCPEVATALRATVLRLWDETGRQRVPLVVFDYLQAAGILAPGDARTTQLREQLAVVIMDLRRLSRENLPDYPDWPGCPVVVLSLTGRSNVAGKEGVRGFRGRPDELRRDDLETLKALPKEAGEIEGTAVTAWVLAIGSEAGNTGVRPLTLRLAKNRAGPDGHWIPFVFDGRTGAITEEPERFEAARAADKAHADYQRLKEFEAADKQADDLQKLKEKYGPRLTELEDEALMTFCSGRQQRGSPHERVHGRHLRGLMRTTIHE